MLITCWSVKGGSGTTVVVDAGSSPAGAALQLVAAAGTSLLVLRPCYLALRRAVAAPVRPSGVVLVREAGRALGRNDVEEALQVPPVAVGRVAAVGPMGRATGAGDDSRGVG